MSISLSNLVKERRVSQGLTQEELATRVGVTRQTIFSIEKGVYSPSVTLALLIARQLKVKVDQLFSIQ